MKSVRPLKLGLLMVVICLLTMLIPINLFAIDNAMGTLMINTTALPDGTKTYSYNATVEASGGVEPYTWLANGLPLGLSIDPSSGVISGIPTPRIGEYHVYNPQFVVRDANGVLASKYLNLNIYENQVRIIYDTSTRPTLPTGYVNTYYSVGFEARYGMEPYTWSAQNLPAGLQIDSSTGDISGVPTVSGGPYYVTITVQEPANYSHSVMFMLTIEDNPIQTKSMITYTPITFMQTGTIYGNDVQYQSAAEVIAALPEIMTVTLEDNTVIAIPISWTDTDSYNPAIADDYTFTAAWGNLPEGVDNDNGIAAPSVIVAVAPGEAKPPIASFNMTPPDVVAAGEPILVDASASFHPDPYRVIVSYEWDWDAGSDINNQIIFNPQDTGITQSHLYAYLGTNRVALRITDDIGQQAIITKYITVEARRTPIAIPGGPYEIIWGEDLFLDGSGSYDPDNSAGDSIVSYWWDINGDGIYDLEGVNLRVPWNTLQSLFSGRTLLPTDPVLGYPRYIIRLKVTDTTRREHVGFTNLAIWEYVAPPAACITTTEPISLSEAVANNGSLTSGVIAITIDNGSLAADITKSDVTAANLPEGFSYTVTRTDETHLEINITGYATNHTNSDDVNNLTFTIVQGKVTGAESNLSTGNISIDFNDPSEVDREKGYPDAPAIATKLLKAAGIKHNYNINGVKGNYISDIARMMKERSAFNGVEKSDYDEYVAAVKEYLESRGIILLPKSKR